MTVTVVNRGETVLAPDSHETVSPMMILSACDAPSKGYYCEPCRVSLANVGNLVMHLDGSAAETAHRIAAWCPRHRVYEAVSPEQIAAIAGAVS